MTVGQDLVKLELGGASEGGGGQTAGHDTKAPASPDQPTSSDPEPKKDEGKNEKEPAPPSPPKKEPETPSPPPRKESAPPSPPPKKEPEHREESERKVEEAKPSPPPEKTPSKSSEQKGPGTKSPYGNRDERRVRVAVR